MRISTTLVLCLLTVFLIAGCATAPKDFETPTGPMPAEQFGSMEIIGIINRSTTSLNESKSNPGFSEEVTVEVPVGTEFIIPSVRGWSLAYGELDPNTVEAHIGLANASWKSEDHHFGISNVNIFVKDINAPDLSANPPKQTAMLDVSLNLGDYNLDDKWFGEVNYTLLCLRRVPAPSPSRSPR